MPSVTPTTAASSSSSSVAVDLSKNLRVPALAALFGQLSAATAETEAWATFFQSTRDFYGRKSILVVEVVGEAGTDYRPTHLVLGDGRDALPPRALLSRQPSAVSGQHSEPGTQTSEPDDGVCRGGFVGQIIATGKPQVFSDLSIKDDEVFGNLLITYRSALVAPYHRAGRIAGWIWLLALKADAFKESQLEEFALRCGAVGEAVERIRQASALREALTRESAQIERVAQVRASLLPQTLPDIRGVELAASHEAASPLAIDAARAAGQSIACSADLYRVYSLERPAALGGGAATGGGPGAFHAYGAPTGHPGLSPAGASSFGNPARAAGEGATDLRTGFLVASVEADGPASAMYLAMIDALIATLPHQQLGAADVLAALNRHLADRRAAGVRFGAYLALYDPVTRRLDYSHSAGAPAALLRRPPLRGEIETARLEATSATAPVGPSAAATTIPPLGENPEAVFPRLSFQLAPDDTLLFVSIGVPDARNERGEQLGMTRLQDGFRRSSGTPTDGVEQALRVLRQHEGSTPPARDQTLLAMRVSY